MEVTEALINTPEGIQRYLQGESPGIPRRISGIRVVRNSRGDMQMAVRQEGRVRSGKDAGDDQALATTPDGDLFVAQGLPPYAEITRQGGGFSAIQTAATAALVVRPTTVAGITLWNGEAAGGKSYVIDRLFTHNLVSTAAGTFFGIWACVHPAGMTNPGEDIAASATNVTGPTGKVYSGLGVVGVGETVVNNGWYPWGSGQSVEVEGVLPGSHADVDIAGRLIVPPQGGISLQIVASLAACTFTTGLSWWEMQLALH